MYKFLHTDSSDDDSDSDCSELYEAEVKAIAMAEEEAQIQKEILANYKEGELYCYNPNIKYEPLKRYDVPRFVFSEDSSSDLSDLESNAQNETMAEEEAQNQKDKILAGTKDELLSHYDIDKSLTSTDFQSVAENLAVSPSTDPQSTEAVPSLSASVASSLFFFGLSFFYVFSLQLVFFVDPLLFYSIFYASSVSVFFPYVYPLLFYSMHLFTSSLHASCRN